MTDPYELDLLLRRQPELIVPIRGHDFILTREAPSVVRAQINHEYKRYYGMTLDEIKFDLDLWRPGAWIPR